MDINKLVRDNIRMLTPYSSARHEFNGNATAFLDANENPFGVYKSYPDPFQTKLKRKIRALKTIPVENIFLGNGSDEAIDLLFRIFCRPDKDRVIICPPTYGMYEVCARVNEIKVRKVPLLEDYQLDMTTLKTEIQKPAKLLFICSPNNPTGNSIHKEDIEWLLDNFKGLIVLDEAYIDFVNEKSFLPWLFRYPNLVILQTFSKAYGMAALRIGMAFASAEIITYMNKVKYPYNINSASEQLALHALNNPRTINNWTDTILNQRQVLAAELANFSFVKKIYPSDANFLFIKVDDPHGIYQYLKSKGIIIRYKEGLRITVGTPEENKLLIKTLASYDSEYAPLS